MSCFHGRRQDQAQGGQQVDHPDGRGDRARRMPDDRAEPQARQRAGRQQEPGRHHRSWHAGMGEGQAAPTRTGQQAWVRKKKAKASTSPAASAAAPATAALAASTAQRRGTATRVVRISPVEYSEVNVSTPRMLTGEHGVLGVAQEALDQRSERSAARRGRRGRDGVRDDHRQADRHHARRRAASRSWRGPSGAWSIPT